MYTALMHEVIYERQGREGKGDWKHAGPSRVTRRLE